MAREAPPGELSLAGGVFFVVTTYKSRRRHLLSDSGRVVSMFALNGELYVSFEKENIEETCLFHVKISGLLSNQLKTNPFPFKENKLSFILYFYLTPWIKISYLRIFF